MKQYNKLTHLAKCIVISVAMVSIAPASHASFFSAVKSWTTKGTNFLKSPKGRQSLHIVGQTAGVMKSPKNLHNVLTQTTSIVKQTCTANSKSCLKAQEKICKSMINTALSVDKVKSSSLATGQLKALKSTCINS